MRELLTYSKPRVECSLNQGMTQRKEELFIGFSSSGSSDPASEEPPHTTISCVFHPKKLAIAVLGFHYLPFHFERQQDHKNDISGT